MDQVHLANPLIVLILLSMQLMEFRKKWYGKIQFTEIFRQFDGKFNLDGQLLLLGGLPPPDPPTEFKLGGLPPPQTPRDTGGSAPRPPTVKFGGSAAKIRPFGLPNGAENGRSGL